MKKRTSCFLICALSLVLSWGAGGISFADNTAEISLQVSYPSGKDYVSFYNGSLSTIDDSKTDYYINVHITLLDENGEPATAGPGGEDLSSLTATLTTSLGVAGSIVADEFLSDNEVLHFDVDTGVGPAARGHVRYACQTGCVPGDDTIEVTVESLTASTEVEVKAPDAYDIVIRTLYTSGAGPTDLFDTISAPSHNAGFAAQAGSDIYFEVWAKEGENNEFTFAPNLEGEGVTVSAYADYDADGTAEGVAVYELIPVATTTAEFSSGKATGNIEITKGGTLDVDGNAQLRVILTATTNVKNVDENKIETAQVVPTTYTTSAVNAIILKVGSDVSSTLDTDTDYVGMIPQTKNKLLIGRDPLDVNTATGNLIEEIDYWYVLDDETQYGGPRTNAMAVFVADIYGNPVTGVSVTINSTISSNLLSRGVTDETNGWNITHSVRSVSSNDGLAVGVNNVRNEDVPKGGGPIKGSITLEDNGLTLQKDTATVYLVRAGSDGANLLDLHVDTDYPGSSLTAGTTLTVYLTDVNGSEDNPTSQDIVEVGDTVTVHANKRGEWGTITWPEPSFLVSGASQSYNQAVKTGYTHKITSSDLGSNGEIKIPIKIWGECTRDYVETVVVSVVVRNKSIGIVLNPSAYIGGGVVAWTYPMQDRYGQAAPQYDLRNRWITDLQPAGETKVKIKELASGVKAEDDDLDADPIVITSRFVTGENSFLTPDSVDTSDDYGNTYNDTPSYGVSADIGIAAPPDATRGCTLTFAIEDAGETGTVTVNIDGVGSRVFNILNVATTLSTKAAISLVLEKEGPALPMAGGEAIVKLTADGTTTSNRQVLISIDTSNSVAGAELREFDGLIYNTSYTASLGGGSPTAQWIRLVVHAPEAGDVVLNAEDTEVGPLDSTSLTVKFYPPDHVAPTAGIDPSDGGSIPPTGEIVITVSDDMGVKLGDTVYSVDREESDITNDLNCVATGDETTEGTITCNKSGGELDLGSYLVSVTPKDLAGNAGTEVTSAFTVSICTAVVTIDPASAGLIVSKTQQFSASTVCNGDGVEGTYSWEIMERGSTGSTIDNNGLYTAGSTGGTDTVKVTDNKNDDASATAQVVVEDCTPSVRIGPSSATLEFTETQQFIAATICNGDTLTGSYSWAVSGSAGGSIDASSGLYTAGSTAGTDTVTVTDTKYGNATDSATVVVEPPISIEVSPDSLLRSRWVMLPYLMTIQGTDTNFSISSTQVSFAPAASILGLSPLILGAESIWQLIFVNPSWLAGAEYETVTVTVTTGSEVVSDDVAIEILPSPLDE